jgi:hypothetical protein
MRLRKIIAVAAAIIFLSQLACKTGSSTNSKPTPYPLSKLNPYRGAVKDLLPQQVGEYKLVNSSALKDIEVELSSKPLDGLGAIYNTSSGHTVQHLLVNFPSSVEANKELDAAIKRYNDAHKPIRIEDIKDAAGQLAGRRVIVNDGETEALNWTNGSLYCTAVSYTGFSSEFARGLPYY